MPVLLLDAPLSGCVASFRGVTQHPGEGWSVCVRVGGEPTGEACFAAPRRALPQERWEPRGVQQQGGGERRGIDPGGSVGT